MESRRNFISKGIKSAGALTAVSALGAGTTKPAQAKQWKRKTNDSLIRVGALTSGYHHHLHNIWGPMINPVPQNGSVLPRMNGMVMTHVWDIDKQHQKEFAEKFNVKQVERYDGMVGEVDAIMICEVWSIDHWPQLAAPYLKAGIPVFFNRPFASSMGRAKAIVNLSKETGTPICTLSSWEYSFPASAMRRKMKVWGGDKPYPTINGVVAYNTSADITHDIHGLWLILAGVGHGVESVSADVAGKDIYKTTSTTWTFKFKPRGDDPPFFACLVNTSDIDSNGWLKVITDKGTYETNLMFLENYDIRRYEYFNTPLIEFQKMVERWEMPQTYDHILDKTAVFLAGVKSHREHNGAKVRIDELPDDYYVQADTGVEEYPKDMFKN
ncbi:MAG: Gfo/Idh/MocA family oxidoreductase [Candidatus Latescibacteria bacterium]|nr:Gfo/Idh/MocA family oxidoreductase [Candidatus Latescibacterota bacterium]